MRALGEWRFDGQLAAEIGQPVLLVQGGASPPRLHHLVAHLATVIPNTEVATIDGENHPSCSATRPHSQSWSRTSRGDTPPDAPLLRLRRSGIGDRRPADRAGGHPERAIGPAVDGDVPIG